MSKTVKANPHVVQEAWVGKPTGLREELEGSENLQQIDCPNCSRSIEFYPDKFYWDFDGDFECCDVSCSCCREAFQLCAADGMLEYTFFTSEI